MGGKVYLTAPISAFPTQVSEPAFSFLRARGKGNRKMALSGQRDLHGQVPTWMLLTHLHEFRNSSGPGKLPLTIAPDHLTAGKSKHENQRSLPTISKQRRGGEFHWTPGSMEMTMFVVANTALLRPASYRI